MRALILCALLTWVQQAWGIAVNLTINANGVVSGFSSPFPIAANGTATLTPFGSGTFSATGSSVVSSVPGGFNAQGTFQINFSGGNILNGTFSIPAATIFPQIGQVSSATGTATITGGTGQFQGATGSFPTLSGTGTATGASSSSFTVTGTGDVSAPNYTGGGTSPGLRFVPVTPCRVADTRNANGPFGGPVMNGPVSRDFVIPSSTCGVPTSARAYSLNVTVVPRGPLSFLTIWPAGQSQPLVSTLNSFDGRIKANAAIVPAGAAGAISVYVTNPTDVILDINGYFIPVSGNENLTFYPVTPCRVADTRNPAGPFGGPTMAATQTRSFTIPNSACSIPSSAKAYSLNMTVVPSGPLAYLTTWPTGVAQPLVSTLNALTGTVTANAAIVPAGDNGAINVFVTNPTDVVIDINGYFAPPNTNGLLFYTLNPCRISDTRNAAGQFGGPSMTAGQTRAYSVLASSCQVPGSARTYSLNATVVPPAALSYLTLFPVGQTQPLVSTLNAFDGSVTSNAAILPAGPDGSINAFVTNITDLLLDINGYFAP